MTYELSHGYLTTDGFRMGLGYPLITVPFYLLIGKDALFIPNLAAFAGTLYFSYLLFSSLTNELLAKISVLFMIFATTLPYHHVIWWNHGITIFCLIALSYLAINSLTNTRLMLAGFLAGLAFFTRYFDVLVFLPILIHIIWHSKSPKFRGLILTFIAVIPFIIAPFVAHWLVFGDPLMSPYRTSFTSPLRIFQPEKIPYHFFLSFLYFPEDISVGMEGLGMLKMTVLIGAFYMIFAPLGAYLLHKSSNRKNLIMGMVASIIVCVLYSSSFWQFHSGTFGQFPADFRYLLLVYPYMILFSVVGLSSFLKIYQRKTAKTNNEQLAQA